MPALEYIADQTWPSDLMFPRLAAQRLYFAGERVQPAVNTVQAPAHVAQADPYLAHLAA